MAGSVLDGVGLEPICARIENGESQAEIAIYALCCPETGAVRYIGKANNPGRRLAGHLREKRGNTPKVNWVQKCVREGKPPTIRVLEWVAPEAWKDAERRLIAEHRARGALLNVADGGDEPYCPVSVRRTNGRRAVALVQGDPIRRLVWRLKRALGKALKDGHLNDRTKTKMRAAAGKYPQFFAAWAAL